MGDPKKKKKEYEAPKKLWDKTRIEKESRLREEFGLKNSRELWKARTILRKIRREARRLLAGRGARIEDRKAQLLKRVTSFLIRNPEATVDDVLALEERHVLDRRLQSIVLRKGLAKTSRQARQLIAHGHIAIDGKKVSSPSYLVKFGEEEKIGWYRKPIGVAMGAEPGPGAEPSGA